MSTPLDTVVVAASPRVDDHAERLTEVALQVAAPADAEVVLSYVLSGSEFRDTAERLEYPNAVTEDIDAILERHDTAQRFRETCEAEGVENDVRGAVGDVADEVIEAARETDADRVIVAGQPRSPAGKAMFGSTAQDVLLRSPCPVTYVTVGGGPSDE